MKKYDKILKEIARKIEEFNSEDKGIQPDTSSYKRRKKHEFPEKFDP